MQQRGFDLPNLNNLFQEQSFSNVEQEDVERLENTGRRMM